MSKFRAAETISPATWRAVARAVGRLSLLGEAQILECVSAGRINALFPFTSRSVPVPPDTVGEDEVIEASALPLDREQRAALAQLEWPI